MRTAIVSGASSGIGLSVVTKLVTLDYRVYGFARDFSRTKFVHDNFFPIVCDVTDTHTLQRVLKEILGKEKSVDVLINNAGAGYFAPHEEISLAHLEEMVRTNLLAPLVLSHLLLRALKKSRGFVINISSASALKSSVFGCAYAATKAGLRHFGISLFDEVRKSGVKVVTINPDITRTDFYEHANFKEHSDPQSYLTADSIAAMIENILMQPEGTIISEITIRPQRHLLEKKPPQKKHK
jgi:short-subunit dehydrogenase